MIARLSRSWPLILMGLLGVIFWAGIVGPPNVSADEPTPAFRILNIKAEYGHMVFEVQHMNADGSHAYWENYTIQGVEWFKKDYVRDGNGHVLLTTGEPAPRKMTEDGTLEYPYLEPGQEYKRAVAPMLDLTGLRDAATRIHLERGGTGWDHGAQRLNTMPLDTIGPDMDTDEGYIDSSDSVGATALVDWFQPYLGRTYSVIDGRSQPYYGDIALPDMSIGSEMGTTGLFYPDSPGGDGYAITNQNHAGADSGVPWATLRAASGSSANNNANHFTANIHMGSTTDYYYYMSRAFIVFPTATLPDAAVVSSGTIGIVGMSSSNPLSLSIGWSDATVSSPTGISAGTFVEFLDNRQVADIGIGSITVGSDGSYTNWTLNATGIGYIDASDVTKYSMRMSSDISNSAPTPWSFATAGGLTAYSNQEDGAGDNRPVLTVEYTSATAAVAGTIGSGATEQAVRDGDGTITLTLTDTTWVADGATFNDQRENIIDGLDAADAQTNGWNAEVRDKLGVEAVERTSATLVTITIPAADVVDYFIVTNEVITATIPATATASGLAITATPTFTIIGSAESAAVSGTLGGSGGTTAEVIAGGETIIITLANTTWVADGATFNDQRQNILDGLVSDDSEISGWNSLAFAVGDVERTNATVVTITLSAESGYGIPAAETITTTVPATSIVYGVALVAPETFTITPTFTSSGTWISPAIDLSSITAAAYCAVGWSENIPAGTSTAVEYSLDGGSIYSTATNGACPFTIGSSLGAVSDFRIRATLTTTISTVTPTITALGVIAADVTGQTVRYQLNTTPALTVTDRTGNDHSGTMSFPALPSGVSTTVGSMTALRAAPSAQTARGIPQVTSPVTGTAVSDNIFNTDETGWTGLPGYQLVDTMATAGDGLPVQFIWYIMLGLVTIMLGFFALNLTQSLFAAGVAMALGLGASIAMGGGLIPGWVIFVFIPVAIGMIFLRPKLAI